MKRNIKTMLILGMLLLSSVILFSCSDLVAPQKSGENLQNNEIQPVLRLVLPKTYTYEGNMGYVYTQYQPGTTPLLLSIKGGYPGTSAPDLDHFISTNQNEFTSANGYYWVAYIGSVYTTQVAGTQPLYRYWIRSQTDHFYTTNFSELGNGNSNAIYEGIQCYVLKTEVAGSTKLHRAFSTRYTDHAYWTGDYKFNK